MFIGYVLAVGSIQTSQKSSTAVAILVPIVALGLPIADTLLAMIRRAVRHRPMFSADRAHIHHKLIDLGLTQKQAVLIALRRQHPARRHGPAADRGQRLAVRR
jgi:UDP-GlcNAc:undecaprenyl-phosphate GlcNAc-1-phosphate transferase